VHNAIKQIFCCQRFSANREANVMQDTAMLSLENQLCFAVYSASHAFTRAYKPLLRELGVTYPQYLVLLVLWERGPALVSEIATALGLDTGTLSPLLKRLEKTGFITRTRSTSDERQVSIELTPEGLARRSAALEIVRAIGSATGCDLNSARQLVQTLHTLRDNLEKSG
jgi:DNA-binding MarR family transcriptional regulator